MPVRPVEELLLHMIVQAGSRGMGRMLIVEDQLGCPVLARLQEAHDLPIVSCLPVARLLATDFRDKPVGYHFRLKVCC